MRVLRKISKEEVLSIVEKVGKWNGFSSGDKVTEEDMLNHYWDLGRRVYFYYDEILAIDHHVESMKNHLPKILGTEVVFWDIEFVDVEGHY